MTEFTETVGSYMQRIVPDAANLYEMLVQFKRTGDKNYLTRAEGSLDKINDAFKAVEDLEDSKREVSLEQRELLRKESREDRQRKIEF